MNNTIVLKALAGSHAHGLATETSDEDIQGVFSVPSYEFWGLNRINETWDGHDPDFSYHELKKFLWLSIKGNPTVIELLYMDEYLEKEPKWGDELIALAPYLLNPEALKGSYLGYAEAQMKRMLERNIVGEPKANKLLKHCFRLLDQGYDIYTKGEVFTLKASPERREFYLNVGTMFSQEDVNSLYQERIDKFKAADTPSSYFQADRDAVVHWLIRYRIAHA